MIDKKTITNYLKEKSDIAPPKKLYEAIDNTFGIRGIQLVDYNRLSENLPLSEEMEAIIDRPRTLSETILGDIKTYGECLMSFFNRPVEAVREKNHVAQYHVPSDMSWHFGDDIFLIIYKNAEHFLEKDYHEKTVALIENIEELRDFCLAYYVITNEVDGDFVVTPYITPRQFLDGCSQEEYGAVKQSFLTITNQSYYTELVAIFNSERKAQRALEEVNEAIAHVKKTKREMWAKHLDTIEELII